MERRNVDVMFFYDGKLLHAFSYVDGRMSTLEIFEVGAMRNFTEDNAKQYCKKLQSHFGEKLKLNFVF